MNLQVFHSVIWQTTSTLITGSNTAFLFDPNYFPKEIEHILGTIENKDKMFLVFTHSDFDHIVGYPKFVTWQTIGQQTMDSKNDKRKREILQQIKDFDSQYYVERSDQVVYPKLSIVIEQQKWLETEDDLLYFLSVPGHTEDGLATFFTKGKIAIVGDMLSDVEFPFVEFSGKKYISTLKMIKQKVNEFSIETLIPGHGSIASSKNEIMRRIDNDLAYLENLIEYIHNNIQKSVEDIQKELGDFQYCKKPISSALLPMHLNNISFLHKEFLQN